MNPSRPQLRILLHHLVLSRPLRLCILRVLLLLMMASTLSVLFQTKQLISFSMPATLIPISPVTLPYETVSAHNISRALRAGQHYETKLSALLRVLVTNYSVWYSALRARCMDDPCVASTTRLLIFRGRPHNYGLGDRMHALLTSYLIAVATDRLFLIDIPHPFPLTSLWTFPPGLNFSFDPSIFHLPPQDVSFVDHRITPYLSTHRTTHRVIIQSQLAQFNPRAVLQAAEVLPSFRKRLSDADVLFFRSARLAPFILQAILRPKFNLRAKLQQARPFKQPYVAVHARLGVGVGETGLRFSTLPLSRAARCLGKITGAAARRTGVLAVFVASDTSVANAMIVAGIREQTREVKVAISERRAVHMTGMRGRELGEKDWEDFQNVFLDVGVLAMGVGLVPSNQDSEMSPHGWEAQLGE